MAQDTEAKKSEVARSEQDAAPDHEAEDLRDGGQDASDREKAKAAPDPSSAYGKEEIGGPKGPEPTRYGDWEKGGRCIDF